MKRSLCKRPPVARAVPSSLSSIAPAAAAAAAAAALKAAAASAPQPAAKPAGKKDSWGLTTPGGRSQ